MTPYPLFSYSWELIVKYHLSVESMGSWFYKPKYKNVKVKTEKTLPVGVWVKCPGCGETILKKQLKENLNTCTNCQYHFRINHRQRIELLADPSSFKEKFSNLTASNPLAFVDAKGRYSSKISESIDKLKMNEAIVTGEAEIGGYPVVLGVMEFGFMGGSMGSVMGEKIYKAMQLAIRRKNPFVIVTSSGGARMHEGILSLMQMAKTCAGMQLMQEASVPFLPVLTDPTTGGVTASFASIGDIIMAEPGALIGFAGPRVIAQTIQEKLPKGFQRAEFLRDRGFIDIVVNRRELKATLVKVLRFFAH